MRFSKRFKTYGDWLNRQYRRFYGHERTKHFYRIRNGHAKYPFKTLRELGGKREIVIPIYRQSCFFYRTYQEKPYWEYYRITVFVYKKREWKPLEDELFREVKEYEEMYSRHWVTQSKMSYAFEEVVSEETETKGLYVADIVREKRRNQGIYRSTEVELLQSYDWAIFEATNLRLGSTEFRKLRFEFDQMSGTWKLAGEDYFVKFKMWVSHRLGKPRQQLKLTS